MGSGYHVCVGRLGERDWRVGPAPHALGCHAVSSSTRTQCRGFMLSDVYSQSRGGSVVGPIDLFCRCCMLAAARLRAPVERENPESTRKDPRETGAWSSESDSTSLIAEPVGFALVARGCRRRRGHRATPSLRQACFREVMEMPSALAASESRKSNLLRTASRSSSTGLPERKAISAVVLGTTMTECSEPSFMV